MAVREKALADDGKYQLHWSADQERYEAGCHSFTYEEAINHWNNRAAPAHDDCGICARARLFLKAIKKHAAEQSQ